MLQVLFGEAEQHMDAWRLNIRIDDRDTMARPSDEYREIRCCIRFTRAAAKGMGRDDFCQGFEFLMKRSGHEPWNAIRLVRGCGGRGGTSPEPAISGSSRFRRSGQPPHGVWTHRGPRRATVRNLK